MELNRRVNPYDQSQASPQFGSFGQCSDAFGPTSGQVRVGSGRDTAKPLNGLHQGIVRPLVSRLGLRYTSPLKDTATDGNKPLVTH